MSLFLAKKRFSLRFRIYEGTRREYLAGRTAMMSIERFREHVRKRNLEILERSRDGESRKALAHRFSLSRCSIDAILHRFEAEQRLSDRSSRLLEGIRQADDFDRPWPVEDLIEAIRPLAVTRSYLKKHFAEQQTTHLSLRSLMEMAIPTASGPDPAPARCRLLLGVYGVGKKGFWSVVTRLTSLNLGTQFKQEWERRLVLLRREWKIEGNSLIREQGGKLPTPHWHSENGSASHGR